VTPGASTQVIPAGNAPRITFVSCSDGRYHGVDAEDVDGPPEIVARIRRMARDFPAFLERFIYNDQCVMLD
jgi:hypothetical protein